MRLPFSVWTTPKRHLSGAHFWRTPAQKSPRSASSRPCFRPPSSFLIATAPSTAPTSALAAPSGTTRRPGSSPAAAAPPAGHLQRRGDQQAADRRHHRPGRVRARVQRRLQGQLARQGQQEDQDHHRRHPQRRGAQQAAGRGHHRSGRRHQVHHERKGQTRRH